MKAIVYDRYGPPEVLRLADVATPAPKAGEVLVRVRAASVNSWDCDLLRGHILTRIGAPFRPPYRILGGDVAGKVAALGDGVTSLKVGDAVFGDISASGWGGFAEHVVTRADLLAAKPDGLSFVEAAAIPQAGSLALQGLRGKRAVRAGDHVLVNGAGGGAGSFAIQIAKAAGAEVTGVDRAAKQDFMRGLGADHVLDYRAADFTRSVGAYDIILDMVANRRMADYRRALKPGGALVVVGGRLRSLLGAAVGGAVARGKASGVLLWKPRPADYAELAALHLAGTVRAQIDRVYPVAEAAEALRHVGEARALGKVVVEVIAD